MNEHSKKGAARSSMQVTLGENEHNDLSKSHHSRTKYKFSRSQIINNLEYIGTVSIHCAPEMSEIDCIGRIESFWPKFVRGR